MKKLSIRQKHKISKRDLDSLVHLVKNKRKYNEEEVSKIIKLMKDKVKKDPALISKFKEYKVPIETIDNVEVSFVPLDVSAKTKNKKIYLNESMLCADSKVKDPTQYLVHEMIHFLQQFTGNTQGHEKSEYLDKDTEIESFKTQVDYKKRNEGKEEAEEYVDDLLDYHNLDGKKREQKEKELLGK
jgi:hypothetical protein